MAGFSLSWMIPLALMVLVPIDWLLSRVTGAVPIYRSKAVGAGIVTGVVLGIYMLHTAG